MIKSRIILLVLTMILTICGCSPTELGSVVADEIIKQSGINDNDISSINAHREQINSATVPKTETVEVKDNEFIYSEGVLEVHFIDVGQGDATLLICDDEAMLIDAGENDKGTLVQNYIFKQGIGSLKYVVGTHPDSDHYGGLDVIITKFECGEIILPNYERHTATCRDVYDAIKYKEYPIITPTVGDSFSLGGAKITILSPIHYEYDDEVNNYSVSLLVEHGNNRFLFTGDAEEAAELDMVTAGVLKDVDVYKAGHHGSNSSSTSDLLKESTPEYAVISCSSDNEYGHPHASVLNRFRNMGVKVFRTDEQGSIIAYSDGNEISWNCAPSETWKSGEFVSME